MDAGLHLYPSALARDAAVAAMCGDRSGVVWTEHHLTFGQFFALLDRRLRRSGRPRAALTPTARYALLKESWLVASQEKDADPPGRNAIEALGRLFASWKGAGIRSEALEEATRRVKRSERLAERLAFLSRAYAEYERSLGQTSADSEGWQREVLERLKAQGLPPQVHSSGQPVVVHGLYRMVPVRRGLIEQLKAAGFPIEIRTAIPLAASTPDARSFDALRKSFGTLISCTVAPDAHSVGATGCAHPSADAEKTQSQPVLPAQSGTIVLPTGVTPDVVRVVAPSAYSEVYEIGRRVRCWLSEGIPAERIAVVFRDLGPYSQFLADVFDRLNLPYFERRGEPLAFQPVVRVALSALDAVQANLDSESLFRFLCAGPVDVAGLSKVERAATPFELRDLALAAHVDRFHGEEAGAPGSAWRARLDRHIGGLRRAADAEDAMRRADVLNGCVQALEALKAPRTCLRWVEDWRALWRAAGLVPERIRIVQARSEEALSALNDALDEVACVPWAERAITLEEFAELLETALAGRSVQGAGRHRAGGVRILNPYDLQGMTFKCVALGGLNANQFPSPAPPDPLLGDAQAAHFRQALQAADPELGPLAGVAPVDPGEAHEEERALWELVRRSASGQLLLSRSRLGFDGQPAAPSVLWEEAGEWGGALQNSQAARPAPPLSECLTGEEAELRAAWVLTGGVHDPAELQLAVAATNAAARTATSMISPPAGEGRRELQRTRGEGGALRPSSPPEGRLFDIARRAAGERQRVSFFEDVASARDGEGEPSASVQAGAFDGSLAATAPEAPELLRARYVQLPEAHFSPSDLETLATCPFRFLSGKVYGIREGDEPDVEPSAQARGSLWHRILSSFYRRLLEQGWKHHRQVVRLEPGLEGEYLRLLNELLASELESMPGRAFTGLPGFWRLEAERLPQELATWLRFELKEAAGENAFRPVRVEFSFGPFESDHAPAVLVPMPDAGGTLRLAGRFDRLDVRVADADAARPRITGVRLIDYKTSRLGRLRDQVNLKAIESLRNAQLPVYLAAAIGFLRRQEERGWEVDWEGLYDSSTAVYYSLRDLASVQRDDKTPMAEPKEWPLKLRDFLESDEPGSLRQRVRERMELVWEACFPVAPMDCGGVYCPARFVCRYRVFPGQIEGEGGGGDA